jgi:hypothetical protein
MSKRKVNFQSATTEAARRELMKPVPSWELVFATAEGSSFKVPKWVKTDKQQARLILFKSLNTGLTRLLRVAF